jgi:transposase-like protein
MTINKKKRGRKATCPTCKGNHTHRKGVRHTTTLGDRELRYCTDCDRKFTLQRKGRILGTAAAKTAPKPI